VNYGRYCNRTNVNTDPWHLQHFQVISSRPKIDTNA